MFLKIEHSPIFETSFRNLNRNSQMNILRAVGSLLLKQKFPKPKSTRKMNVFFFSCDYVVIVARVNRNGMCVCVRVRVRVCVFSLTENTVIFLVLDVRVGLLRSGSPVRHNDASTRKRSFFLCLCSQGPCLVLVFVFWGTNSGVETD